MSAFQTSFGCILYNIHTHNMCRFKFWVFGFKSETAVLTFSFCFLSSPFLSLSLPHFFSLAGHLVSFILVGKSFWESFYDLRIRCKEGRCVVKQDFHGKFSGQCYMFCFAFFSGLLDCLLLILVWFERSLHPTQGSGQSCPWHLKLMTSQAIEGSWICRGGYGQLSGKWVKRQSKFKP